MSLIVFITAAIFFSSGFFSPAGGNAAHLSSSVTEAQSEFPWWDDGFQRRRLISFGENHPGIDSGSTVNVVFPSGYERQLPVDNCLANEGIYTMARRGDYTYLPYLGHRENENDLYVYIVRYDHRREVFSDPVAVSSAHTADDSHCVPSILIDRQGYIYLFYGAHFGAVYCRRSLHPVGHRVNNTLDDIEHWSEEMVITNGHACAYPMAVQRDNNDIYLFVRNRMHYLGYFVMDYQSGQWDNTFHTVVDYSSTGYEDPTLYSGGAVYENGRMHLIFTFWDFYASLGQNKGRAVGYIYSDDFIEWYQYLPGEAEGSYVGRIDGTGDDIIDFNSCHHVIESSNNLRDWPDTGPFYHTSGQPSLVIGEGHRPYFLIKAWRRVIGEQCELLLARWSGRNWQTINLMNDLPGEKPPPMFRYRQGGNLYIDNDSLFIYYLAAMDEQKENYFAGEIYRCATSLLSGDWRCQYLTANTAYGAGMMAVLDKSYPDGRWLYYQRGNDLFLTGDRALPHLRRDGHDIRVVRQRRTPDGFKADEIHRLPDRFGAVDTKIYFKLQGDIRHDDPPADSVRYYLYYDNPGAPDPPTEPDSVFTLYEGFESYWSGIKLAETDLWAGENLRLGGPIVVDCGDMATLIDAHTNKLWSGRKFLYYKPVSRDGSVGRRLERPLTNHVIELKNWIQGAGNYFYIELYDSQTDRSVRCGITRYCYSRNSGEEMIIYKDSQVKNKRFHSIKIGIDSSGVSYWVDDKKIFGRNNHIRQADVLKIGAVYDAGEYYLDDIKIYRTLPEGYQLELLHEELR